MTRKRTKARRHNLTAKQRRAKEAAKPQPEVYTAEEIEAMRAELGRRLDRLASTMDDDGLARLDRKLQDYVSRHTTDLQPAP